MDVSKSMIRKDEISFRNRVIEQSIGANISE